MIKDKGVIFLCYGSLNSSVSPAAQNEVTVLKNEVTQLKQLLLTHKDCPITTMQKESQGYLSESITDVPSSEHLHCRAAVTHMHTV